jgi:HlyD family secretion protein
VVINVDNPDKILLPGMTTYVTIAVAERTDVLLVPNAALRYKPTGMDIQQPAANSNTDGRQEGAKSPNSLKSKRNDFSGKVYVSDKGVLKQVNVSLGITDNRNTEIVSDQLKAGDQIVVGETLGSDNFQSGNASTRRVRFF